MNAPFVPVMAEAMGVAELFELYKLMAAPATGESPPFNEPVKLAVVELEPEVLPVSEPLFVHETKKSNKQNSDASHLICVNIEFLT